jgi:hypothetical protein
MVSELMNRAVYYDERGNTHLIRSSAVSYASATLGDQATPVVAAVDGKKIRVLLWSCSLSIGGSSIYLRNGAGGAQLSTTILRNITGSLQAVNYQQSAYFPIFLFETTAGTALVCNATPASGAVTIQVSYVLV